jgi:hypothetical protein
MTTPQNNKRIIAFDVQARRFSFVVFEGPNEVLDFGARSFPKGPNEVRVPAQEKIVAIFNYFDPAAVVFSDRVLHRTKQKSRIGDALQKEALERGIPVRFVTPGDARKPFAGHNHNKHEIASALAQQLPALASKLPPKRKIWQSEDYRMSIFDAAALGIAYLSRRNVAHVESLTERDEKYFGEYTPLSGKNSK